MSGKLWPLAAILLSACATEPSVLHSGRSFSEITPGDAPTRAAPGSEVRWGGTIAAVSPGKAETCFQVVSRPLDGSARPESGDRTNGRFIACAAGFYDPVIYATGREITVVGTLQAPEKGAIGGYDYLFPKVSASTLYLWPKRDPAFQYPPFWYEPGPWW